MIVLMLAAALCNAEVCPGYGDNLVVENDNYGDGEWKTYVSWESCRVIHAGEITTPEQWHTCVRNFRK